MRLSIKGIFLTLFCIFFLSCPQGNVRQFLTDFRPYADGTISMAGFTVTPLNGSVDVNWTVFTGNSFRFRLLNSAGTEVLKTDLLPGSTSLSIPGLTNFDTHSIQVSPIHPDTGMLGMTENVSVTPGVIFVDQTRSASGTGNDWNTAYNDLQAAMTDASALNMTTTPAQVRVALGTYVPTTQGGTVGGTGPDWYFALGSNVHVVGGFNPGTGQKTGRTILSGDHGTGVYSRIVVVAQYSNFTTLEGFTVRDAQGSSGEVHGLYLFFCTNPIKIVDCEIRDNYSTVGTGYGTGVYADESGDLEFIDTIFSNNFATFRGGAVALGEDSNAFFTDCTFTSNSSGNTGGAIWTSNSSPAILEDCSFSANHAVSDGGAVYAATAITITDGDFTGNYTTAGNAGALYCNTTLTCDGANFTGNYSSAAGGLGGAILAINNATITNCQFTGNYTNSNGGAIRASGSSLILNMVTFAGNWAPYGGAVYYGNSSGNFSAEGCIFERNGIQNPDETGNGTIIANNGGALYLPQYATAGLSRTVFFLNKAVSLGGAINFYPSSNGTAASLNHCVFYNNFTTSSSGGSSIYVYNGYTTQLSSVLCDFISVGQSIAKTLVVFEGSATISETFAGCVFYSDNASEHFVSRSGSGTTLYFMSCLSNRAFTATYFGVTGQATCQTSLAAFLFSPATPKGADNIWKTADDGLRLNGTTEPNSINYIPYLESTPVSVNYFSRGSDILSNVRGVNGASSGWDPGAYAY